MKVEEYNHIHLITYCTDITFAEYGATQKHKKVAEKISDWNSKEACVSASNRGYYQKSELGLVVLFLSFTCIACLAIDFL